jgi:hypothetical protein
MIERRARTTAAIGKNAVSPMNPIVTKNHRTYGPDAAEAVMPPPVKATIKTKPTNEASASSRDRSTAPNKQAPSELAEVYFSFRPPTIT